MEYPAGLSSVYFIRLQLTRGNEIISEDFYWRGVEEGNYKALRALPKVKVESSTSVQQQDDRWGLTTRLLNVSDQPALLVRLKAVRPRSGDRILPAFYSDNYISLMPNEQRIMRTELKDSDARGETPRVMVEGFNVKD
jgi:hypothetical protein